LQGPPGRPTSPPSTPARIPATPARQPPPRQPLPRPWGRGWDEAPVPGLKQRVNSALKQRANSAVSGPEAASKRRRQRVQRKASAGLGGAKGVGEGQLRRGRVLHAIFPCPCNHGTHRAEERVRRSPGFRPRPQDPPAPRRSQAAAAPPSSARNRRRARQSAADAVSEALLPRHTAPHSTTPSPSAPRPSHTRAGSRAAHAMTEAAPHPRSVAGRNLRRLRSSPSRRHDAPERAQTGCVRRSSWARGAGAILAGLVLRQQVLRHPVQLRATPAPGRRRSRITGAWGGPGVCVCGRVGMAFVKFDAGRRRRR
jgi:hypothetical protein